MSKSKNVDFGLIDCDTYWGGAKILYNNPNCDEFYNIIYTPFHHAGPWGLFDLQGQVCLPALDKIGEHGGLIHQVPELSVVPDELPWAPDEDYIYGGRFNPHFGHFLVETLPRLWWLTQEPIGKRKILMHAGSDFSWMHHFPFACDIWRALGLSAENLVTFGHPVRIKRLAIPHVALRQQAFAHTIFAELGRQIGDRITADFDQTLHTRPAYLSKTHLRLAVGRFSNEDVIESILENEGIDIIHPQNISFAEQINIFQTRPCVLGSAGSAFHTCLFSRRQPRQILLEAGPLINTNFTLLERLTGSAAEHYYQAGTRELGSTETVLSHRVLADPEAAAHALLTILREKSKPMIEKFVGPDEVKSLSSTMKRQTLRIIWDHIKRISTLKA